MKIYASSDVTKLSYFIGKPVWVKIEDIDNPSDICYVKFVRPVEGRHGEGNLVKAIFIDTTLMNELLSSAPMEFNDEDDLFYDEFDCDLLTCDTIDLAGWRISEPNEIISDDDIIELLTSIDPEFMPEYLDDMCEE